MPASRGRSAWPQKTHTPTYRVCTCRSIRVPSGRRTGALAWSADCGRHGVGTRFMRDPEAVLDWDRHVEQTRERKKRNLYRSTVEVRPQPRYL